MASEPSTKKVSTTKKVETKETKPVTKAPAKTVAKAPTAPKTEKAPVVKEPKAPKVKVEKQWVRSKTPFEKYDDAKAAQKTSKDSGKPARIVRVITFFIETKQPVKAPKE